MYFEEIETVKEINNKKGYLINNSLSFIADCNSELLDSVNQWVNDGGIIEPEFTDEELDQQELNRRKQEALQYLEDTKWYIERLADPSSGKAVPEDVLAKRAEAREILNELKGIQDDTI